MLRAGRRKITGKSQAISYVKVDNKFWGKVAYHSPADTTITIFSSFFVTRAHFPTAKLAICVP